MKVKDHHAVFHRMCDTFGLSIEDRVKPQLLAIVADTQRFQNLLCKFLDLEFFLKDYLEE